MPMWRPPQTIRSPGLGATPGPAGTARPVRCAHAYTASTEPKPCPTSPMGAPACDAHHDRKYAHQGPTPLPAVAVRYSAIRGPSLEPGGCSATPTSACAAAKARCPAVPAPSIGADAGAARAEVL